jgi:hypothetical protein
VTFEPLTFLVAEPIHEEAQMIMHHEGGDKHIRGDAEGGDARQESEDKIRPAVPKNSWQMARRANTAGMCGCVVKNPIVPEKP